MVNTKGSTHSGTDTDFVKEGGGGGGGGDVKSPTLLTYSKLDCQQKGRVWTTPYLPSPSPHPHDARTS